MKKILSVIAMGLMMSMGSAYAADAASCSAQSAEKKLAGAAKASFEKKCMADGGGASAACEKSAADKKLAGAAKTSHVKKCMADASPKAEAKPAADAKPAAAAKMADAKPAAKAAEAKK